MVLARLDPMRDDDVTMDLPAAPDAERRESLLVVLGELIGRGGSAPFLTPPVVPGELAFPEPWRPTRGGVAALLRRLAWHAGNPRAIHVLDERLGAPPTERKPATRVALVGVRTNELPFRIEFLGTDDVAGTLAHELGVAHAVVNRREEADPYRATARTELDVDPEQDLERGSIATIYLGLGTLAANAAFQQYSRPGRFNGGYSPLEYDVLQAGFLPMSDLAFLLAVQAAVRGSDVPPGLKPPQRDEVSAWLTALRPGANDLRERLGIHLDAKPIETRPSPVAFTDIDLEDDAPPPRANAFRWRTHRGGVGFVAGVLLGAGVSIAVAAQSASPLIVIGLAGSGHVLGRRIRVPRCTGCAGVVAPTSSTCPGCGAALRGDIESLADRLDAEDRLDDR